MHFAIKYVKMQINNGYESGIKYISFNSCVQFRSIQNIHWIKYSIFILEQHVHFSLESYEYPGIM